MRKKTGPLAPFFVAQRKSFLSSSQVSSSTSMWFGHLPVLLFLVAVPGCASLVEAFGAHDVSRIAQVLVCSITALVLAWSTVVGRPGDPLRRDLALASAAALSLALLSVWHAPDRPAAMRELAMFLGLFSISAVVACSRRKEQLEVMAVVAMGAALLNAGLVLLLMVSAVVRGDPLDLFSIVPGYDNPRFLSHVQTVMLPLSAIAAGPSFRRGEFSRLAWAAMALNFVVVYFAHGRATGLALLGASLLALLLFGRAAVPLLFRLAGAAVVGLVIYLVLFIWVPSLLSEAPKSWRGVADTNSFQERLKLWRLAIDYVAREPWLGIGPMHYAHFLNPIAAHPHNFYLQLASEWGLPMLLGLLAWAAWALRRMTRAIAVIGNNDQSTMGIALFCAVVAAAIDGIFSGNFVMPVAQVWIAFALGWAVAWTRLHARSVAGSTSAHWPRAVSSLCALFVFASQLWLCGSIAPEVADLQLHLDQVSTRFSNGAPLAARFWSTGWF